MNMEPGAVFGEYEAGLQFMSGLGNRGLFEQSRMNERFYIGDQWHGANCGNERPLVRHNVIKRIGDYKMSQILSDSVCMNFSAEGIPTAEGSADALPIAGNLDEKEIRAVMNSFSDYFELTGERVNFDSLTEKILRSAFITGSAVLYTYWDSSIRTGLFADAGGKTSIRGDIACEVLDINNVVFGDVYCRNIQNQPYILIYSKCNLADVLREARLFGAGLSTLTALSEEAEDGQISVITKLFKKIGPDGSFEIKGVKVTEKNTVRREFSTNLRSYPISLLRWNDKNGCVYGESEITYLIPNQIAINRMITANVWSAMTAGMPIMLVNGDTVSEKITNDPGQIIRVYGSNEDVSGAIQYVSPAANITEFDKSVNTLITNTLTQSGANEVALGDSKAENATALFAMRDAALLPLQMLKLRFYTFLEDTARIWADFWITHYGKRRIKTRKDGETRYADFDGERYRELIVSCKVQIRRNEIRTDEQKLTTLLTLFEKGILNKKQLLERIPSGEVDDIRGLLAEAEEETDHERV